jgi:nucleoside-diphosphate-sugar epimerase
MAHWAAILSSPPQIIELAKEAFRAIACSTPGGVDSFRATKEVLRYLGKTAEFKLHPEMPTGPLNRVAENFLAKRLLGWKPQTMFMDGFHKAIDWYLANKKWAQVSDNLDAVLTER